MQWIRMATDYKIVVVPDTGGTRCILGLQLVCVYMGLCVHGPVCACACVCIRAKNRNHGV